MKSEEYMQNRQLKGMGVLLAVLILAFAGCGGPGKTVFLHPEYNFSFVERVAVVPFENLTNDQGAGARVSRLYVTELLATDAFDVVEPGEVAKALQAIGVVRTADLTQEQTKQLGQALKVQAVFLGSVNESSTRTSGSQAVSYVTLTTRLVETETGITVWSATTTAGGRGFWSSLFGTATPSHSEVTRECVRKSIGTLVN